MGFRPSLKGGCFLTTTTATAVPMCSRVRAPHVVLKARLPWVPFSSMWAYLCHSIGVFGSGQALEKPCTVLNWSLCSPAILWWIVKDMAYDNQFWSPVVWELFLGCCPGYLPVAESLPPPTQISAAHFSQPDTDLKGFMFACFGSHLRVSPSCLT